MIGINQIIFSSSTSYNYLTAFSDMRKIFDGWITVCFCQYLEIAI